MALMISFNTSPPPLRFKPAVNRRTTNGETHKYRFYSLLSSLLSTHLLYTYNIVLVGWGWRKVPNCVFFFRPAPEMNCLKWRDMHTMHIKEGVDEGVDGAEMNALSSSSYITYVLKKFQICNFLHHKFVISNFLLHNVETIEECFAAS